MGKEALLTLQAHDTARETRLGVTYGLAAYLFWGFFPLFFKWVAHVPPLEVLAHRIVWSLITLLFPLAAIKGWGKVRATLTNRKALIILCATTILISTNWFVFIFAVDRGQVLQSSFGYFINPLVSVLLGFLFLGERLRRVQVLSLALAIVGVIVLTVRLGSAPWIALVLAISFALYGLLRKIVPADALTGLAVETLLLFPAASGYILYLGVTGKGAFPSTTLGDNILLPLAGVITAIPLLWFSAAARLLRLATIGFMQYITPTIHFLLAVLAFGEPFTRTHLAGFACIWAGLLLYSYDVTGSRIAEEGRQRGPL
ncbi:MAG TPA: EamA family transporter RarD [Geobacteraceae bacterium]|nr:EamA family transporter RarD [Geobacteraceae bacterium]